MKCERCVKEGKRSTVRVEDYTRTLLAVDSYYDEDGFGHSHDPNTSTTTYRCSNGHTWKKDASLHLVCIGCAERKKAARESA